MSELPARAELRDHERHVAAEAAHVEGLENRMQSLRAQVTDAQAALAHLEGVRLARTETHGRVAVGELTGAAASSALDRADDELATAEAAGRDAERAAEIAEAGIARLEREHFAAVNRLGVAQTRSVALKHDAAVELAASRLAEYRRAAEAFASAHAKLAAAAALADEFADPSAQPARLYLSGKAVAPQFVPWLPQLPGVVEAEWNIDARGELAGFYEAAMIELLHAE